MSGRKLGGGRILGSGKGLAPPTPVVAPRAASPVAPSESSIGSLASSSSSPPPSAGLTELAQDLGATISVGVQAKTSADGSGLVCPICSEEMVTLLQLNRHIDDTHQELPEEAQDEVKTWFDKQVNKAKRFQPLSIINSKIRGLEVFESNESSAPPVPAGPGKSSHAEGPIDPDELITRSHWQRTTMDDHCTDPTCGKSLGPIAGSVNCRHCGRLFCEAHTMYQMKLSRSAKHEPVRGYWARVCETCFVSRDGYNDHHGVLNDHTKAFADMRKTRVEREALEVSRLEKRLTKLTQMLANPPENLTQQSNGSISSFTSLAGQRNVRKQLEQSIVTWEDDNTVSKCPFCQQEFGSWTFRRHHCRICGRVVCADPATGCSSEVGLNVAERKSEMPSPNGQPMSVDIRMCRGCKHTIFSGRDFAASLSHKPPDQKAYETLRAYERNITFLLPLFHRALLTLQPERSDTGEIDLNKPPPTHQQIQEAAKLRKRLVDSFSKYNAAARRMKDLPTGGKPMQENLQAAVYTYASNFLHTNMLPLKSVPSLLRNASSSKSAASSSSKQLTSSHLRHSELATSSTATPSSIASTEDDNSTVVSALESEERSLRERLVVLEEQKFMVEGMVKTARNARRFEEVTALGKNVEELEGEIRQLREKVGEVENRWEGVYGNGHARR